MSHRTRRLSALTGVAALTLTTLVVGGAPAQAHPAGDRAVTAGATWLEAQLTDGLVVGHYPDSQGNPVSFTDHGLTADVAFALDAVGGRHAEVVSIANAVAPLVTDWYDFFGTVYTGSAAKAAALAQVASLDADDFGGQDLQGLVEGNVATDSPIVGRVQNVGETDWQTGDPADSLNVISQGWAARALTAEQSTLADEVEAFLLDQQCEAGYFRYGLTSDKTATEQGCVDGVDTAHMDTTSLTVINLLAAPGAPSAEAAAAVEAAVGWLGTQQADDGSFSAGGTEGVNANTTGLAAWALAEGGDTARATKAASWLRNLQVADLTPCASTLTADNGAVAFNGEALTSSRSAGSIDALRDQFVRTSAQALPALAQVPAGTGPLALTVPATVPEKSPVAVTVSGLGAGEVGCVSLGPVAKHVTGTGSDLTVSFDLPAGASTHAVEVTAVDGSNATASITTTAAPAPTLPPAPPATAPPVTEPSAGELRAKRVVRIRKNRFRLAVECETATDCEGRIVVRSKKNVIVQSGKPRKIVLARTLYRVAPGETRRVVLKVRKKARPALAGGKVKVRAIVSAPDDSRTVSTFWLRKA